MPNRPSSILTGLGNCRFGLLFLSLLLILGGSAVLSELGLAGILNVLLLLCLLMMLAVLSGRWTRRVGLGLFAFSLISWGLSLLTSPKAFLIGSEISTVILLNLGTLACFRRAFSPGSVDRERLSSALALYLLLGLIFALVYTGIAERMPGAFHFSASRTAESLARPLADMVYFSFVTLATLGYGDIVPFSPVVKGLAILEAIVGQIYLVVVVARLVSLYGQSESTQ